MVIDQFGFIGSPRPPSSVIDAINAKVQAQQIAVQKQNELVQAQADAAKLVAAADGQAKAQVAIANGAVPSVQSGANSPWMLLDIEP